MTTPVSYTHLDVYKRHVGCRDESPVVRAFFNRPGNDRVSASSGSFFKPHCSIQQHTILNDSQFDSQPHLQSGIGRDNYRHELASSRFFSFDLELRSRIH